MHIAKVVIKNYRCLKDTTVDLNAHLNILVGNNECGKSTFLEAVNLALSGLLNGRSIHTELHTHLFNTDVTSEYIQSLKTLPKPPPAILIELYLDDVNALAGLKGQNNSLKLNVPGLKVIIEFNDDYKTEYAAYVAEPSLIKSIPVEYYSVRWRNFADNEVTARSIPIKPCFIDASTIRNNNAASRYVLDTVKDGLSKKQRVDLGLAYRTMKDRFLAEKKVTDINAFLAAKKGDVSDKTLSISLDTSSRASWEAGIIPHLDDIPMPLVGKGEQNSVKIKLAMEESAECHLFLIEEAENHLSFSNLNILIKHISEKRADRQLLITTHSSFVLNKLGLESVLLFANGKTLSLKSLKKDTKDYFLKLPGYDTLRLILAKRAILVEGPSDELIVQKAFLMEFGKMPLEVGVDVISVSSLAFKRFLDIALVLDADVDVVTDNDGDIKKLKDKYADYDGTGCIDVYYDDDVSNPTLEPQILKANSRDLINTILDKSYATNEELLKYMHDNKTECALKLFETKLAWTVPEYITNVVYRYE
jgi:putative ATP-dependent endonuclease of the OLD family